MGCSPRFSEATKLINYINRAEIVKNFTNFACGVCERAIKYPAFIEPARFSLIHARVSGDGHRFLL